MLLFKCIKNNNKKKGFHNDIVPLLDGNANIGNNNAEETRGVQ